MLGEADRRRVREDFGVDDEQVRRDHAISHILATISDELPNDVLFFGGTALARTYLPGGRLSEDIDLIAVGTRRAVAERLVDALDAGLARELGRPAFSADLGSVAGAAPVSMSFPTGVRVKLQLLPSDHYPAYPFAWHQLDQRYADAAPARLRVPTLAAFVAWKTAALLDRRSPRDLWDLAALARIGAFTPEAAALFTRLGPSIRIPSDTSLPSAPTQDDWVDQLSHQTRLTLSSVEARDGVVRAWQELASLGP